MGSIRYRLRGVHPTSTDQGSSQSTIAAGAWLSTSGNDSTGQGTFESPWRTYAFAETQAASWENQTLWIKPGTFTERLTISFSGSTAALVYIRGQVSTNRPVFRPSSSRAFMTSGDSRNHVQVQDIQFDGVNCSSPDDIGSSAFDLRFRHCDWFNHGPGASSGFNRTGLFLGQGQPVFGVKHIEFYDCAWYDNGSTADNLSHGCYLGGASSCLWSSCRFSSNGNWGFHGHTTSTLGLHRGTRITNSVSDHNGAGFILVGSCGGSPSVLTNCIAHNNVTQGFMSEFASVSTGTEFNHCVAAFNGDNGFRFASGNSDFKRRNCISFGNSPNVSDAATGTSTSGNLEDGSNPSWVSTSDFHLSASTSKARNIGTDIGVNFDIEGNGRIGNPDAGAYEFQG